MISFLAPAALAGLALLAIPVILHLFKPRKVRKTPFSSLRWLHLSQQKLSRRIKWHQVLLFFLRAAFIALLATAAAKPLLSGDDAAAPVERFVVLDTSRSMRYRPAAGETPMDTARKAAASLAQNGLPGNRTTVVLAGSKARPFGPLTHDPSPYLQELQSTKANSGDADLGAALQSIRPMLARRRPEAKIEIDLVTDNQQSAWRSSAISSFLRGLDSPVKVRIVDVGVAGGQNAWIADARIVQSDARNIAPAIRVQVGCVGDAGQSRTIHVSGIPGMPEITRTIKIEPRNFVRTDIDLAGSLEGRTGVARIRIEPSDALADDDEFLLSLDPPPATHVLLIEPDDAQIETLRPAFHLRTAFRALAAAGSRTVETTSRAPMSVLPADIERADVIVLADASRLTEAATAALEARVKAGAGMAIFLGPHIDLEFYNNRLFRPLLPSDGLLPARLRAAATAGPQRVAPLANADWTHPLLAPLYDPALSDLAETTFRTWYQMDKPPAVVDVPTTIADGSPLLIDRALGQGRVVLLNTTANDAWSDLPRRKSFVPFIDLLLNRLAGAGAKRTFAAGESISFPLPGVKATDMVTVVSPGGMEMTPLLRTSAGRTIMRLDNAQETGIYKIGVRSVPSFQQSFIVQPGRSESALGTLEAATLRKWWEPATVEILSADDPALTQAAGARRVALWPWLVGAACLVFLAEMFLVHWLCPRMNPKVAAPVVPRRGILPSRAVQSPQVATE